MLWICVPCSPLACDDTSMEMAQVSSFESIKKTIRGGSSLDRHIAQWQGIFGASLVVSDEKKGQEVVNPVQICPSVQTNTDPTTC